MTAAAKARSWFRCPCGWLIACALAGAATGADPTAPQATAPAAAPATSTAAYTARISGEVLHANTLEFAGLAFRDVVAKPLYAGTTLSFTECQATAYGGKVTGHVELLMDVDANGEKTEAAKDGGSYHCHFEVDGVDLGTLLSEFGGNNANVDGVVAGWIDLEIPARHPQLMTGRGELAIAKGSLVQLPLLANLLIGDPSNSKGQDSAMARFEFRDSQIQVLVARLSSPACKIAIKGTVGFDGDLRLYLIPKFKFDLIDQFPGLGPIVAPLLSSVTSRVARALIRGQITKPVLVINPFMKEN